MSFSGLFSLLLIPRIRDAAIGGIIQTHGIFGRIIYKRRFRVACS